MRTGSSALTRGLGALGMELGNRIQSSDKVANPTGFWEDTFIYQTLHQVYRAVGLGDRLSTSVGNIPAERWQNPEVIRLANAAADYIRKSSANAGAQICAFKNPSIGRLMPFWRRVIKIAGADDYYIVTTRSPAAVAASAKRAWNIPADVSYALWVQFTIGALLPAKDGRPTLVVDYDEFLDDPAVQLARIAAMTNLCTSEDRSEKIETFCREFVRPELRHFDEHSGQPGAAPPPLLLEMYDVLQSAARDGMELNSEVFAPLWHGMDQRAADFTCQLSALDEVRRLGFARRLYWRTRSALRDSLSRMQASAAGRLK